MKSIILPDYNANIIRALKSLHVEDKVIPKPVGGQVLVKIAAAPCNPSDIAFMRGGYNIRKTVPVVMGFEGTGTVVAAGSDPDAKELLGKRVSCFTQGDEDGTWAEYFVTGRENCIELIDDISDEQAAAFCVNPFTAYALVELAKQKNAGAIIQNAASGQVGIFIRTLAGRARIPVINLVRKEEHIDMLLSSGEKHLINTTDESFETDLKKTAHALNATVAFDAVGGELSGAMLNAMPRNGTLVLYGGLSGKAPGNFNPMDIIFENKSITGFNLGDWKEEIGTESFDLVSQELQSLIAEGGLKTKIQGSFKLDQAQEAVMQYIRNMSGGKILFEI